MKIDIVMIGDSYTEGYAAKNNETIAAVLKEFNFSVVNIGKAGNGPLLEFATLNEYAKPLKPKILLWLFYRFKYNNIGHKFDQQLGAKTLYTANGISISLFNMLCLSASLLENA